MRVVLDSSTLVSAFLSPAGTPAMLLSRAAEGAFALCISAEILTEVTRALSRERTRERYGYAAEEVERFAAMLVGAAELVSVLPDAPAVSRDPTDDVILETAVVAKADLLVTGDNDLLILGEHQGVRIVTPRQFLDAL
jgi:putative PIN family toxin of toxin-antitoxin system